MAQSNRIACFDAMDRLTLILDNLSALGGRKLAALGLTFLLVVGLVSAVAYYLSRPNFELLYAGLDREDVSRIGAALKSSGVAFDVNPEGNAVSVPYGQTSQARMLLADPVAGIDGDAGDRKNLLRLRACHQSPSERACESASRQPRHLMPFETVPAISSAA